MAWVRALKKTPNGGTACPGVNYDITSFESDTLSRMAECGEYPFQKVTDGEGRARSRGCMPGEEKMRGCLLCRCLPNGREDCTKTDQCKPIRSPQLGACVPGTVQNTKCRKCVCMEDRVYQCERACAFEVHRLPSQPVVPEEDMIRFGGDPLGEISQKEVIFAID
ncbi:hypothetical protein AAG570_011475 [Ranatra chinensis]|uniref:Pacifastin domain-containing protein n=1 Tax=Ranatra chinensis TaxID=642074 RepID=A0ABD0Z929_9HEMI